VLYFEWFFAWLKGLFTKDDKRRKLKRISTGKLIKVVKNNQFIDHVAVIYVHVNDDVMKSFEFVKTLSAINEDELVSVFRDEFKCLYVIAERQFKNKSSVVSREESLRR
jgi:hypothetical protein